MSKQKIIAKVNIRLCQKHMMQLLEKYPKAILSSIENPYLCDVCIVSKKIGEAWHAVVQATVYVEVVSA